MLIYLIDAFNLIHKIEGLADSVSPHARLIEFLKSRRLTGSPANRVVVVFDGYENSDVAGEREYEIVFGGPKSADDVIKERVARAKNRSQIVVVSDDKGLTFFVKGEGAKTKGIREFLKSSARSVGPVADGEKEISYEERRKINEELERLWVKDPPYDFTKKKR